jgi:malate synthase
MTISLTNQVPEAARHVVDDDALAFVALLERRFGAHRVELLERRSRRQADLDQGVGYDFLDSTAVVRGDDWTVVPPPHDLADRRCEITGPTDRKMVINALNSGARVFMADFEDSNSPTWANLTLGQVSLFDAIRRQIDFTADTGKRYELTDDPATLMVRPRGLHMVERHVLVDGEPVSASLFDFGVYFHANARELMERGSGPYFYLPKLESHHEARWWNDVFLTAQDALGIQRGTIRATVLVETIPAVFEMDEILFELREHSAGLNAGLRTCHRRRAHAMGGMAAFIPSRRDEDVNRTAFAKVREDKLREATDGCDGTWVAHPDLVPLATEIFDEVLGDRPNQIDKLRPDVEVGAGDLTRFIVPGGEITEAGVRQNVDVAVRYIASWLRGTGAAAIYNLMEDAATAEISRSQIWQWVHSEAATNTGVAITPEYVRKVIDAETDRLRTEIGHEAYDVGRYREAVELFERVALADDFPDFLTIPAYEILEEPTRSTT